MRMPTNTQHSSTARQPGRPCSLCAHRHRAEIDAALEMGVSVLALMGRFEFSRSAGYRHLRLHLRPETLMRSVTDHAEDATDLLSRLTEVADDMRNMRRAAVATGNVPSGVKAADAEVRAVLAISERLGVDDSTVIHALDQLSAVARAALVVAEEQPQAAKALLYALEERGAIAAAETVRQALQARADRQEIAS